MFHTGESVQVPMDVNAVFGDTNYIHVTWSNYTDRFVSYYLVSYNGSDGSKRLEKVELSRNGLGNSETLPHMSKCNNYKVEVKSVSIYSSSKRVVDVNASTPCSADKYKANECSKSQQSPYPFISYNDTILPNNSYIDVSGGAKIGCHTDFRTCCNRYAGSGRGDWYYPDGTRLQFKGATYQFGDKIYEKRYSDQRVELNYMSTCYSEETLGVYCCRIETNAVNGCDRETVCVGL